MACEAKQDMHYGGLCFYMAVSAGSSVSVNPTVEQFGFMIFCWRDPVDLLEFSLEMTSVLNSRSAHDFFDAQFRCS